MDATEGIFSGLDSARTPDSTPEAGPPRAFTFARPVAGCCDLLSSGTDNIWFPYKEDARGVTSEGEARLAQREDFARGGKVLLAFQFDSGSTRVIPVASVWTAYNCRASIIEIISSVFVKSRWPWRRASSAASRAW